MDSEYLGQLIGSLMIFFALMFFIFKKCSLKTSRSSAEIKNPRDDGVKKIIFSDDTKKPSDDRDLSSKDIPKITDRDQSEDNFNEDFEVIKYLNDANGICNIKSDNPEQVNSTKKSDNPEQVNSTKKFDNPEQVNSPRKSDNPEHILKPIIKRDDSKKSASITFENIPDDSQSQVDIIAEYENHANKESIASIKSRINEMSEIDRSGGIGKMDSTNFEKDSKPEVKTIFEEKGGKQSRSSPEKIIETKSKSPEKIIETKSKSPEKIRETKSPEKIIETRSKSPEKIRETKSPEKIIETKSKSPEKIIETKSISPENIRKIKSKSPEKNLGDTDGKNRSEDSNYVEGVVCQVDDVPENGMKVCDLGTEGKVLVLKKNGQFSAIGTKCSHYGAPLVNGALGDSRIRCPWHGACFNIKTGDIEDFPGLDSIPCYNVQITPEGVRVRAKLTELKSNKREKSKAISDANNTNKFVIIGGGAAGQVCAETLRQEGFTGQLVMITADKFKPYDRIKLSKQLDITVDKIQLRSDDFYKNNSIDIKTETEVTSLNTETKSITLLNGEQINYTSLFIATGGIPRRISLPGINLQNIFTLRSLSDANMIQKHITPTSNIVIYGSSFIGMEAAAYCVGKAKTVTVVGRSAVPFAESLGNTVGERVAKLFTDKGVCLKMICTITSFEGDGKVQKVILSNGTELPADIVILGLGASHATNFLKNSGIKLNENGSVPVNKFLETNSPGVYAGGDIAQAPVYAVNDMSQSIGHWGLAHYHGRIAALNMMSNSTPLKTIPFFWTMLFGTNFRFTGTTHKHDNTIIKGNIDDLKFAVYYCNGDKIIGVTTVGVDPLAAQFAELLQSGKTLTTKDIESNPLDWFKNK